MVQVSDSISKMMKRRLTSSISRPNEKKRKVLQGIKVPNRKFKKNEFLS
jgi:hypothetical protein